MRTALIIHGHFYQPPRENPCTGIVERQPTASPYKNWNEAVYQTCYKPNAHSRYLDSRGKIRYITNNYDRISANFGPTLLNWMDAEHPRFIKSLLESDQKSMKLLGHSNFIAQCYNHTILPLDRIEIKRIEISWALQDYKKHFGHDSEGFWCSECAIDKETIDVLAESGVKFVILSPWQAVEINGKSLNGKPAPCDRPFIINGFHSSLAAFFYDPDLASGISFGHYLTDADKLYSHLKDMRKEQNNPALISCATDGEIYGHHEAFGDMALSALIKKVDDGDDFYITNYGAYLAKHPATETATLFNGKKHLGSSWSCIHGVERWCSDCGCHTGGPAHWNQKWREPLRESLKHIEVAAREIIGKSFVSILGPEADLDNIMNSYGQVVVQQIGINDFVALLEEKFNKKLASVDKQSIAILCEAYKYVLFSFTSCGWFFNDITGIEPRQNIAYAINAVKLLQPYTKAYLRKQVLSDLENAKSNMPNRGTGADIAKEFFDKNPGSAQAATFFIKNRREKHMEKFRYYYGFYHLRSISESIVILENTATSEIFRYSYGIEPGELHLVINLKNIDNRYNYSVFYDPHESDHLSRNAILAKITSSFAKEIDKNGINESQMSFMLAALDNLRTEGVEPELSGLQNILYPYLAREIDCIIPEELRKTLIEKLNFSYDLI